MTRGEMGLTISPLPGFSRQRLLKRCPSVGPGLLLQPHSVPVFAAGGHPAPPAHLALLNRFPLEGSAGSCCSCCVLGSVLLRESLCRCLSPNLSVCGQLESIRAENIWTER